MHQVGLVLVDALEARDKSASTTGSQATGKWIDGGALLSPNPGELDHEVTCC